jgi:hypothetical protein
MHYIKYIKTFKMSLQHVSVHYVPPTGTAIGQALKPTTGVIAVVCIVCLAVATAVASDVNIISVVSAVSLFVTKI